MPLTIEVELEDDGRWLAEVPELPGVLTYGQTRQEAIEKVQVVSLRVLADRLDHGEPVPQMSGVFAFHDDDEIGPRMLSRIAKHTGLTRGDL